MACGGAVMQQGVYGQTLPIDGKIWRGGWAKLSRKEVILCGNFPLSCQHVSQDQGRTAKGSNMKQGVIEERMPRMFERTSASADS